MTIFSLVNTAETTNDIELNKKIARSETENTVNSRYLDFDYLE